MEYIEPVLINEIVWRVLSGHFGDEFKAQRENIDYHCSNFLLGTQYIPDWIDDSIRFGLFAKTAGSDCPISNLILRKYPKSKWNEELKFSRYSITQKEFENFYEINYDKRLRKAMNIYLNNPKVISLRDNIKLYDRNAGKFDWDELNNIILYKIKSKYIIIDGVHRAMAMMFRGLSPETVIILDNEIQTKRIFFKKQLIIDGNNCCKY